MSKEQYLPHNLTLEMVPDLSKEGSHVLLSKETRDRIDHSHQVIQDKIKAGERLYGINTGFGPLVVNEVDSGLESRLQHNLVHQLNANVGEEVDREIVRLTLAIRLNALSKGHSGIRSSTLERLIELYNEDLLPTIKKWGSVGASGDLVPLSRFARAIIGKEELRNSEGNAVNVETLNWSGFVFEAKEALAIVNGTSFSLATVSHVAFQLQEMFSKVLYPSLAQYLVMMDESFQHLDSRLYSVKAHPSALTALKKLKDLLPEGIEKSPGVPQPPYSSRSLVLWMGAIEEKMVQAISTIETELNSVDDNPLVFDNDVIHGANFQGTYVTYAAELLTSAVAGVANLLERQINRILHKDLNGKFPAFLAEEPVGLNSGLQGYQLLATSLLADIKAKSVLHSAFTIPTNQDNQDIVSMSANAANNLVDVQERLKSLMAVYTLIVQRAVQLDYKNKLPSSEAILSDYMPPKPDFGTGNLGEYLEFTTSKLRF